MRLALPKTQLRIGLVTACALLLSAACSSDADSSPDSDDAEAYHSRPDLAPPITSIEEYAPHDRIDGSYVFVGPKGDDVPFTGGLILDDEAEPVWVLPTEKSIFDLRVQEYNGEPVLTYWRGEPAQGHGNGDIVLLDDSYQEIATVTTGGEIGEGKVDIHESTLTDDGTALLISYVPTQADLTSFGGEEDGWVFDSVIQEVDVESGEVVFEWHSLDHFDVSSSVAELDSLDQVTGDEENPFSYFHLNSVTLDDDGDLLLSSRNTSALYKIDHQSGEVIWTLGGAESDFAMGADTEFHWQHDAERQPDGSITLFDNQGAPDIGDSARGIQLEVDEEAMTVELAAEFLPPDGDRTSGSQGSFQLLPDGTVLIGWGSQAYYSEYAADGTPLSNVSLGPGHSYRAYREVWSATPTDPPDAVLDGDSVFVSWNGATEVEQWRLVTDGQEQSAQPRDGFETELPLDGEYDDITVEALDENGEVIGEAAVD
ncbi:arylsulfotransferase family protein [Cumulibacter soli]|uniref:arylsulfotransferase family protein n=1 Tax=Cumulibacter soli TaxID=2546344 RepID=UPI0010683E1C|nr:arylsulfotransferase family protein [Cumulibacter soli]